MSLRLSRAVLAAVLSPLLVLTVVIGTVPATATPASPGITQTATAAGDGPNLIGTLTDLLSGILSLLLGGKQPTPAPPTSPVSPAVPAAPAGAQMSIGASFEDSVVVLVNKRRHKAGCQPLRSNEKLRAAARTHSIGMARYNSMAHFLPGEASLGDRISYAGYKKWRRVAENIAAGFGSARGVMSAWMNSPSHRRNILDCNLRHIGVGVISYNDQLWWTQDFGRR